MGAVLTKEKRVHIIHSLNTSKPILQSEVQDNKQPITLPTVETPFRVFKHLHQRSHNKPCLTNLSSSKISKHT